MASKHIPLGREPRLATAEIAVMGPDGAVSIVFRNELAKAKDAENAKKEAGPEVPRYLRQPVQGGRARVRGRGDPPEDTRPQLCRALLMLRNNGRTCRSASTGTSRSEARKDRPMQWNVAERVGRVRWIFLPLGLCALVAVGAHASAEWWVTGSSGPSTGSTRSSTGSGRPGPSPPRWWTWSG